MNAPDDSDVNQKEKGTIEQDDVHEKPADTVKNPAR